MPDKFTVTTTTGYGGRIVNSIKGVVIGFILFIASFGLLYWNEGRVDLSGIAKTAVEIGAQTQNTDASLSGKLVSVSGAVSSEQTTGDNLFLKPGAFIAVERKAEMYAWVEKTETTSKTNVGGSETTETTYSYTLEWTEHPEPSGNFMRPEGHENPQKPLDSYTNKVTVATVGVYAFDPQTATLPPLSKLPLHAQNIVVSQGAVLANDSYLFLRKSEGGTLENPQIGDARVSYHVLRSNFSGSLFGALNGTTINAYFDGDNNRLYHVFAGTREEGIATLHSEYTKILWILRLVGFLMMWFGLMALFGPISVFLDILPIFGAISRSLVGIVTFAVSIILALVTIVVSAVIHSFVALLIALAVTVAAIVVAFVMWKKKRVAA